MAYPKEYSHNKNNKMLIYAIRWVNFKNTMLSAKRLVTKGHIYSLMQNIQNRQLYRDNE